MRSPRARRLASRLAWSAAAARSSPCRSSSTSWASARRMKRSAPAPLRWRQAPRLGLLGHARARTVKWPCALVFAAAGVVGAALGAAVGKEHRRRQASRTVRRSHGRRRPGDAEAAPRRQRSGRASHGENAPRLLPLLGGVGLVVGFASGFFGIGGGFLIVPGLVGATAMPIVNAIGSSLVSVTAFGATTASATPSSASSTGGSPACSFSVAFFGSAAGTGAGTSTCRQRAHSVAGIRRDRRRRGSLCCRARRWRLAGLVQPAGPRDHGAIRLRRHRQRPAHRVGVADDRIGVRRRGARLEGLEDDARVARLRRAGPCGGRSG